MSLEEFIYNRTKILKEKLKILLAEMNERLRLKNKAQLDLNHDKSKLEEVMHKIAVQIDQGLRDYKDKDSIYQKILELNKEKRREDREYWLDNMKILRDFLETWDSYEQARAKGRLLRSE